MSIQQPIAGINVVDRVSSWFKSVSDSGRVDASLFLYLGPEAPARVSWAKKTPAGRLLINSGTLEDFVRDADTPPLVLVPGSDVLLTEVKVPSGKRSRAVQSAPYMIEEYLAEDVESLHFSYGSRNHLGMTEVAVVSRSKMTRWLRILSEAGIVAQAVVPATLLVPEFEGRCSVVVADGEWLVRCHGGMPFSADLENLNLLLELVEDSDEEGGKFGITFFADDEENKDFTKMLPGREIKLHSAPFMQTMVEGYKPSSAIDLLQGEYSKSAEWRTIWNQYQFLFWSLVVLVVIGVAGFSLDYSRLSAADKELDAEMISVFRETFPNSKRTDNPRMRMESRLKALRLSKSKRDVFFMVYDQVIPVISQSKESRLLNLRFKDGRFDFDMELESLQGLDDLKEVLGKNDGIRVEIRNATASGNKVRAIMQVTAGK